MKKSHNIKKSLSMLPLLALAFSGTSIYPMEVEQPKDPQVQVFITSFENETEKNLTITIDNKNYTIQAGKTVDMRELNLKIPTHQKTIDIKHNENRIGQLIKKIDQNTAIFTLVYRTTRSMDQIDQQLFNIKPGRSYNFNIELHLEGKKLNESYIDVNAIEK